jgi:hypothetical protein
MADRKDRARAIAAGTTRWFTEVNVTRNFIMFLVTASCLGWTIPWVYLETIVTGNENFFLEPTRSVGINQVPLVLSRLRQTKNIHLYE